MLYGNGVRFVQSPTEVVMTYEMIHDSRVIYLDNRPHVRRRSSRGWAIHAAAGTATRWSWRRRASTRRHRRRARDLKLTEWFTRVDPEMIEYKMRIEDPEMVTAPFTMRYMLTTQPDYPEI